VDYTNVASTHVVRYSKRVVRTLRYPPLTRLQERSRLTSRADGSPRDHR
jgi:hypothetical protein